ncbi:MAG: recombination protein RecR, partial [Candidatus Omnitrophica bacterium]|nr:recombination protein RecR [Candidatus Omnitrophota bacterium]
MALYTRSIEELVQQFKRLPGIGTRSAERLALYILGLPLTEAQAFAQAIIKVKERVKYCQRCNNLSEEQLCGICSDPARDQELICVVEEPKDVSAFEKTGSYRGQYHVLMGSLSPLDGIGPEQLRFGSLIQRLRQGHFKELIVATDADAEGDATALYIVQ